MIDRLETRDDFLAGLGVRNPRWMTDAACRQPDAVDMFPTTKPAIAAALATCGGCTVMAQCRTWALDPDLPLLDGVAGGMTPAARRLIIRNRNKETRP